MAQAPVRFTRLPSSSVLKDCLIQATPLTYKRRSVTGLSQTDGCVPPVLWLWSSLSLITSKAGCKPALRQDEQAKRPGARGRADELALFITALQ